MYSGVRVFGDPQPGDIILMYYGAWPNSILCCLSTWCCMPAAE
mgnify:CR=1 FL=1